MPFAFFLGGGGSVSNLRDGIIKNAIFCGDDAGPEVN